MRWGPSGCGAWVSEVGRGHPGRGTHPDPQRDRSHRKDGVPRGGVVPTRTPSPTETTTDMVETRVGGDDLGWGVFLRRPVRRPRGFGLSFGRPSPGPDPRRGSQSSIEISTSIPTQPNPIPNHSPNPTPNPVPNRSPNPTLNSVPNRSPNPNPAQSPIVIPIPLLTQSHPLPNPQS